MWGMGLEKDRAEGVGEKRSKVLLMLESRILQMEVPKYWSRKGEEEKRGNWEHENGTRKRKSIEKKGRGVLWVKWETFSQKCKCRRKRVDNKVEGGNICEMYRIWQESHKDSEE